MDSDDEYFYEAQGQSEENERNKVDENENEDRDRSCCRSRSRERRHRNCNQDQVKTTKKKKKSEQDEQRGQSSQKSSESPIIGQNKEKYWLKVMHTFLVFFEEIQHEKGFSFTDCERKKLIKEQQKLSKSKKSDIPKIAWNKTMTNNQQQEEIKIYSAIKECKLQFNNQEQRRKFIILLKETSKIFCSESTNELYRLLAQIWIFTSKSQILSQIESEIREFMINEVSSQYTFFGYNFSKLYQLKDNFNKEYNKLGYRIAKNIIEIRYGEPAINQNSQV